MKDTDWLILAIADATRAVLWAHALDASRCSPFITRWVLGRLDYGDEL